MPVDDETKGVNRRLLLLSAWTVPVVASFALGGQSAAREARAITSNLTLSLGVMARTSNNTDALSTKTGPTKTAPTNALPATAPPKPK